MTITNAKSVKKPKELKNASAIDCCVVKIRATKIMIELANKTTMILFNGWFVKIKPSIKMIEKIPII
ncbi:hypothetical protein [Exiguobacterium acetylicum]|uniref:hypothetical protein n=1 Tax=Exiguobacterium acetylicum TaxID=41170 RepID=UPI0011EFC44D|nr:hypothetical protein [Exiguobacterium acetylicum]